METIRRRLNGVLQDIPIYRVEEAKNLGLDMVPWKEVKEGQWAITDDGYVTQCLGRKTYSDEYGKKDCVRLSCGRFWSDSKKPFYFEERAKNKSYYNVNPEKWIDSQYKTKVTKLLVHAVVTMILSNKPIDYDVLANIYRQKNIATKSTRIHYVRLILNSEKVKDMINAEIEKALLDQGMTLNTWLELGMRILKKAEDDGDLKEMRLMWQQFGDVLHVKEHESRQVPVGQGAVILDAVSQDLKKIPVSANGQ